MKFSLSWLKEHLETNKSALEIGDALVSLGLEVEDIKQIKLDNFVVAHVVECVKHPNADRLSLCKIDDGSGTLQQVVCGATNVRQDLKIAFARLGCIIPSTGEALKKGKIRDIESCGMICSAQELCLGEDSSGIMELETDALPGTSLADALNLNEAFFDISITPNRSDCFSVYGIARDLAAKGIGTLKEIKVNGIQEFPALRNLLVEDFDAIPYFSFFEIKGVKNSQSPKWLKDKIESAGQNSISTLVDIANYIMFDLGQPLHIFDADQLKGDIRVQKAIPSIKFKALDEVIYTLDEDIVVCDNTEPHALAGLKGGFDSSTQLETTNILVEAAFFNPINIATSGQKFKLFSDARARFERGIDHAMLKVAHTKAINLILELCGGEIIGFKETGSLAFKQEPISFTKEFLMSKAGEVTENCYKHLEKLGCKIQDNSVMPPSWRHDLKIPEDLVEEVLRLEGYDHIKSETLPLVEHYDYKLCKGKQILLQNGMHEVYTFSMISDEMASLFSDKNIILPAPLNQDLSTLRPSLLPSLIHVALVNKSKSSPYISIFEKAPVFNVGSAQELHLSGLRMHHTIEPHWAEKPRMFDVFDVKADALNVLKSFNIENVQIEASAPNYYHPKRSGCLKQGKKILAYFGELHPSVLKKMGCTQPCVAFEVIISDLPAIKLKKRSFKALSPYQLVTRDFAFMMDKDQSYESLLKVIQKTDSKLIRSVQVFDVFAQGNQKSVAVKLKIQSDEKTLTDAELMNLQNLIIQEAAKIGAVIRDGS